ncbi:MAG: energy-coupling factor transporter transmembrane component T, partial [Clostridia bacterium]|nr:energy-coupling factor transporter transmembrane component T [Clostridia bacterium]
LLLLLRGVRPILPIIVVTSLFNAFYVPGDVLLRFWVISVSKQGLVLAVFMTVRIVFLIAGTSMLTYTTSPIALTDGLERLMSPLKVIRVPVHELSMMMTIALRFIPTLIEETDKIMSAQKARGADFETGNLIRRVRALVPVMIPLFVSAFRRAGELALAMDCRCYRGGEGRTRLRQLRFIAGDFVAALLFAALLAGIILLNIFFKSLF